MRFYRWFCCYRKTVHHLCCSSGSCNTRRRLHWGPTTGHSHYTVSEYRHPSWLDGCQNIEAPTPHTLLFFFFSRFLWPPPSSLYSFSLVAAVVIVFRVLWSPPSSFSFVFSGRRRRCSLSFSLVAAVAVVFRFLWSPPSLLSFVFLVAAVVVACDLLNRRYHSLSVTPSTGDYHSLVL